ncbi:benzoate 4-monooxygenase cytochrome P450, putative [Paecilomyces variotii No. 5]|uniref:Benzoate 4-monooxygenase cytochrome P450, putative n=1 Tax=Byssochlamys spectabilis (strain No. 5 / NBRC 109023) TaxID=1356009 RepID=V5FKH8_BYSSN|nr:benzoate 4-monooxygenase cytochrome P450, putative [Paecilomyces variotii No. 5]
MALTEISVGGLDLPMIFPILAVLFFGHQLYLQFTDPLRCIPGSRLFAITRWRLAYEDWKGTRTRKIHELHTIYGPVVRIAPTEISFNSLTALRSIYGAGSKAQRTDFYRMFDVYGRQNLFTFGPWQMHAQRKKMLNHAYAKSTILRGHTAQMVEGMVVKFLGLLENEKETAEEIFTSLHYFSLDTITHFLYGPKYGGTAALTGRAQDRALLNDILDPSRRRLSWFAVHLPRFTKWLYSRSGTIETTISTLGLLPMKKPATYTGIRAHALQAWRDFKNASENEKNEYAETTIIGRLWRLHRSQKGGILEDLDIASECADHLLAGIDTTSDTLMFLIWALSLPENQKYQEELIQEVSSIEDAQLMESGLQSALSSDKLPYMDALIKEALRLYAPLPASEPRSFATDVVIDSFRIPKGTTVSMEPYALHRNSEVFPEPGKFNPHRWLCEGEQLNEMKKWWWAFSSGGRVCIGMQYVCLRCIHWLLYPGNGLTQSSLAMAEMTTLLAAVYRNYRTSLKKGFEDVSPGITSRFEVFYDDRSLKMEVGPYLHGYVPFRTPNNITSRSILV